MNPHAYAQMLQEALMRYQVAQQPPVKIFPWASELNRESAPFQGRMYVPRNTNYMAAPTQPLLQRVQQAPLPLMQGLESWNLGPVPDMDPNVRRIFPGTSVPMTIAEYESYLRAIK